MVHLLAIDVSRFVPAAAVLAALFTAAASLVVAIITQVGTRRTQGAITSLSHDLEKQRIRLTNELQERREADRARRDYEYDARRRLYTECEPLIFQALEFAEGARSRVASLARSARHGDIEADGSGWLSQDGYYRKSAAFLLLAPLTTFRILQRRLTTIDLSLEPRLHIQYELLKLTFFSFTEDHALAALKPCLPYDPDRAKAGEPDREASRTKQPAAYRRQGFFLGTLETVVDSLITTDADRPRCLTFGEFSSRWLGENSPSLRLPLSNIFAGFHPRRQPVLWRVLVCQAVLHDAFIRVQRSTLPLEPQIVKEIILTPQDPDGTRQFDWRRDTDEDGEEVVGEPFQVAMDYLDGEVTRLVDRLRTQPDPIDS